MISQIFMLSSRGDILINRDIRGDLNKETPEIFFRTVKLGAEDQAPVFNIEGITYIYLLRESLYIVATTRFNVSPLLVLEYLGQLAVVIKDFCGVLSEEALRKNFVLVYEIIEEMLDFGYPQVTSTEQVQRYVVSAPDAATTWSLPGRQFFTPKTIKVNATQNPITNAKERNEIFIDVVENLVVLFNSSNVVINAYVDGCLRMKSYLTGTPSLKLFFNNDSEFDDVSFHECVDDVDFNFSRKLVLAPPAGEFDAMKYRLTKNFQIPFKLFSFPSLETPFKVEFVLKIRSEYAKDAAAKVVNIVFKVPELTSSVYTELEKDVKDQKASYNESAKEVRWKIEFFAGDIEHSLTTKISLLKEMSIYQVRKEMGPVKVNFEMNQASASKLTVTKIEIEGTEKENPSKWVRNIMKSNSFVARI